MDEVKNAMVSYPLRPLELEVLMGLGGVEKIYSFRLPDQKQVTDRQLVEALFSLVKKGHLQADGEQALVLSGALVGCIHAMKAPDAVLEFRFPEEEPDRLVYWGSMGGAVVESSKTQGVLRLSWLDGVEFPRWAESLPIWEHVRMHREQEMEWLAQAQTDLLPEQLPDHPEEFPGYLCAVNQMTEGRKNRMVLVNTGGIMFLLSERGGKWSRKVLTTERYQRLFEDLFSCREVEI